MHGWKRVYGSELSRADDSQPVILYASLNPAIRQLKWRCLSGELRIDRVEVKTTRGEKRSFTFAPAVLQAGLTTPPLDLSGVARGTLIAIELREAENLALSPYLSRMLGTLDAVHVRGYAIAPTLTGQALAVLTKPPATT